MQIYLMKPEGEGKWKFENTENYVHVYTVKKKCKQRNAGLPMIFWKICKIKLFYISDFELNCICVKPVKNWRAEPPVRFRPESAVKLGWLLSHLQKSCSLPFDTAGLLCEAADHHLPIISQSFDICISQERIKDQLLGSLQCKSCHLLETYKGHSSTSCVLQQGQAEPRPGLGEEGASHSTI